ncbi:hypothetical protein HY628_00495 [Candidatus Uhrbacteria bacterium]|nr:hypothetical protein [Candidatus Uhrbacteria bacterium]
MPKSSPKSRKTVVAPPSSLYRKIAISFLLAALALFGVVIYISFARATIIIKPKREALTAELTIDVGQESQPGQVAGAIFSKTMEQTKKFSVSGGGTMRLAAATGTVVIKNKTSRDQTLVRTTRLLTPEGQLFHIDRTVVAPAGGSVTVGAFADQEGPEGEIGPTRFTIPGLWAGLQDKIYAVSSEPFCCGTKEVRAVTTTDIEAAEEVLQTSIIETVRQELETQSQFQKLTGEAVVMEVRSKTVDAKPGQEQSEFSVTLTMDTVMIRYDRLALETIVRETLRNLAGAERSLVELDPDRIAIEVARFDPQAQTARLGVEATGLLVLRPGSGIFDKERLSGLDRAAMETYFKTFRAVEAVRIEFQPPWLRTIPRLKDHVEIKIEE